jgi:hypothetical protein
MAHLDSELLSAYIDHELPAADVAAVERHLAECDDCRAEYNELRGLSTLVRELPVYLPKREIDVSDQPRGGSETLAKIIAFSKPLAIAAVVLLVAFAGLRLLTDDDTGDNGDQISFSAVQPTETGTELVREASEEEAAGESAAEAPPADDALGEAPPAEATMPPPMGAMPAMEQDTAPVMQDAAPEAASSIEDAEVEAESAMVADEPAATPATTVATPEPAVIATAAPTGDGGGSSWLPEAVVTAIVVAVAGAAGWYTFIRKPERRRP